MKSKILPISLLVAFSAFFLSSCDKKEDETPVNNNTTNTFSYDDAFGVLVAVKSVSYTSVGGFEVPVEVIQDRPFSRPMQVLPLLQMQGLFRSKTKT